LIGTDGHAMVENIREALNDWSDATGGSIEFVWKGQNLLTEMYSALEADVPVSKETSFNQALQESLLESRKLLVCGQAMSHCVNYTLRDIVDKWPKERRNEITLLTDCASAVPGFEKAAEEFQEEMKKGWDSVGHSCRGLRVVNKVVFHVDLHYPVQYRRFVNYGW
jgi:nicotinamidase-related amidase